MATTRSLDESFRPYADALIEFGQRLDRRLVITSARRTLDEQWRLYDRFLRGESRLPVAVPGTSKHELGLAFDIARIGIEPHQDNLLPYLGAVWRAVGGLWNSVDPVHFSA